MRALREACAGISRFPGRTAVSVLAIAMALILFGAFGLVAAYSNGLLDLLRGGEEISVYLKDELSDAGMLELDSDIAGLSGVESTRIVSKEDAAAEFERMFGENLLSSLDENPLPRSIVVAVVPESRNAAGFESIGKRIEAMPGVEMVEFGREWLVKMDLVFFIVMVLEVTLGILIGVAGIIIVANTIGMTVIVRRETIEIMRLVGATESFIRRPFFLEGIIQGFFAGLLAVLAFYGPYFWARASLPDFAVYLHTFGVSANTLESAGRYLALLVPVGTLLGFFGSHVAVRRTA